jgi:hypothetical protein
MVQDDFDNKFDVPGMIWQQRGNNQQHSRLLGLRPEVPPCLARQSPTSRISPSVLHGGVVNRVPGCRGKEIGHERTHEQIGEADGEATRARALADVCVPAQSV